MTKEKENGRTNNSGSKPKSRLAATITRKRQRNASDNAFDIPNNVDAILTSDANDIDGDASDTSDTHGDVGEFDSGSGSDRGSGRNGSGRSDRGSDGDSDNNTTTTPRRRGRRSAEDRARELSEQNSIGIDEARKIIESQKKPRKVKSYSDDIGDGVVASALLLGAVFEGGSELFAMSVSKQYLKLSRPESTELSDAVLKVLDTLPKSTRKKFDAFIAKYYPYWNLAKVVTKISYPRYLIYQMEKDVQAQQATQSESGNTVETENSNTIAGIPITDTSKGADFDFGAPNFG